MDVRPSARRRAVDARLGLTRPGDPVGAAPIITLPGVVGWPIAVMALVFAAGIVLPDRPQLRLEYAIGFVPVRLTAALAGVRGADLGQGLSTLVSHAFVHGNLPHIALNGLWMAVFGTGVARRLSAEGRGAGAVWNKAVFLAFFAASAAAGGLAFLAVNPNSPQLLVGASGAISGLMAAAMRFALRPFAPYGPAHGPLAGLGARPVAAVTVVYIGFNLATALGLGGVFGGGLDIAWEAHIGGYVFGLLAFPLFDGLARRPRPEGFYPA